MSKDRLHYVPSVSELNSMQSVLTRDFQRIDWCRPWLVPFVSRAAALLTSPDWRTALNQQANSLSLQNHRGLPVRFVPQAELPVGVPYEHHISTTGHVPTRENLHDFFNALVWLHFPRTKIQLNALQAAELDKAAVSHDGLQAPTRGKVRDAATIFDENAALIVVRDAGWIDRLRLHDWKGLFIEQREAFQRDCEVWLFGHALMEKLVNPYKATTAHAYPIVGDEMFFSLSLPAKLDWLDEAASVSLQTGLQMNKFTPLPVLGVPGWWEGQSAEFYSDVSVFRPKRPIATLQ